MRYLAVKNFDAFQHYKDRNPPWIKLYNTLLDDYAFLSLPDAARSHLMLIWLIASRHGNRIPYDAAYIARAIHATGKVHLATLIEAGFLSVVEQDDSEPEAERKHDASKPLAKRSVSAMPEREGEKERETETETTTSARAMRETFADVAAACDSYDAGLFDRLLEAVADRARPEPAPAQRAILGRATRALGVVGKGRLSPGALGECLAQYVDNLATGGERSVNASRFESYLQRAASGAVGGVLPRARTDDADALLTALEDGGLTTFGGNRAAYQAQADAVAAQLGRDPDEFRRLLQAVQAHDLGRIAFRPERLKTLAHRLATAGERAVA